MVGTKEDTIADLQSAGQKSTRWFHNTITGRIDRIEWNPFQTLFMISAS